MLSLLGLVFCFFQTHAQMKDPSTWNTQIVAAGEGTFNVEFNVKLEPSWHMWSLDPGGDGTLIAPSFDFEKGNYTLIGKPQETGKVIEAVMEGIDGKVRFFSKEAQIIQAIKGKSGETVKGSYTYQLCNDMMCLPPKTVPFSVRIP